MIQSKLFMLAIGLGFTTYSAQAQTFNFQAQKITPSILARMTYTWNPDSPVPLEDLRYLSLTHYDFNGLIRQGEIVVHKETVEDFKYIFEKLFEAKFPIESMKIVDEFEGSDLKSMQANNTSAFYARKVAGTNRWSNHSFGCAIDINPLLNPYSKEEFFTPPEAKQYLDRTLNKPGMITKDSYIYKLFKDRGWEWGGECFYERDKTIDRHHFQKTVSGLNKNTN